MKLRPLAVCAVAAMLAGCTGNPPVREGRAVSMLYDPNRVAGLPASDSASGALVGKPSSAGRVRNTDGGHIDRSALLAVEDIEDYWRQHFQKALPGSFSPVTGLVSIDPEGAGPVVCDSEPYEFAMNAAYCLREDVIVWDRRELLPVAAKFFGDLSVNALLAHEYGHALQHKARLINADTTILVSEQQADCFAGVYLRWVAEGNSPRFTLNTTTALDKVLAGAIAIRDRAPEFSFFPEKATHGTALDRVGAFQQGFDIGAASCTAIDTTDIARRRGDVPASLFEPSSPHSNMPITEDTVRSVLGVLNSIFAPDNPPALSTTERCVVGPAAFCPGTNTIAVDIPALRQLGIPASEQQQVLLQGDNSAISVLTSRYMLALQEQRGVSLDSETTALRTACLTGVAQSKLADPRTSGDQLVLSAGDIDEAVSGLLTNGIVASDVNAITVPSGFTRILAFRAGLAGDAEACYMRFPDR